MEQNCFPKITSPKQTSAWILLLLLLMRIAIDSERKRVRIIWTENVSHEYWQRTKWKVPLNNKFFPLSHGIHHNRSISKHVQTKTQLKRNLTEKRVSNHKDFRRDQNRRCVRHVDRSIETDSWLLLQLVLVFWRS